MKIYLLFWIFSIAGWLMEEIVCSISDKKIVNRGFLIGPYCPIYGFGSLIMLLLSSYKDSPLVCFVLAFFLCSVLEYFTSYIMEKAFKIRWWDYSNDSFNINGRVCLRNAMAFGALGVLFTRYMYPLFSDVFNRVPASIIKMISIILFFITFIDIVFSFKAMNSIKNIIKEKNNCMYRDATEEVKELIHKRIVNIGFLERRLVKTYHLDKIKRKLYQLKSNSGYNIILIFLILGIILGIILGLVFKIDDIIIIISFTMSVAILISIIILKARGK